MTPEQKSATKSEHTIKPHHRSYFAPLLLGIFIALLSCQSALITFAFAKDEPDAKTKQTEKSTLSLGEQAFEAFDDGNYITALKLAKKAAENKESSAYTLIGRIYATGSGVPQNMKEAAIWYQKGADNDQVHSLVALGTQYATGEGVKRNQTLAANLYEKAANLGEPQAQYNLALIYAKGDGRRKDLKETVKWMLKAAENDMNLAQYALGTLYTTGSGIEKDLEKAALWIGKAAKSGLSDAELDYGILLFKGRGIKKDDKQAFNFFRSAAYKGNPVAQNRLARLYAYGIATNPDPVEAARWHILARNAGVSDMKLDLFIAKLPKDMKAAAQKKLEEMEGTNGLY